MPESKLYDQLADILNENSIESVLDTLAIVIKEDEWDDATFQAFAVDRINATSEQLKDNVFGKENIVTIGFDGDDTCAAPRGREPWSQELELDLIPRFRVEPISTFTIKGDRNNYAAWVDGFEEKYATATGETKADAIANLLIRIKEYHGEYE